MLFLAVAAGVLCCFGVIAYAEWLSRQILVCPEWAVDCSTAGFIDLNANNAAVVQGLATIIYSIGLVATASGTKCIVESAIWPILCTQDLTVKEVGTYLQAASGPIPSTTVSWRLARTKSAAFVLIVSAITTLVPLVAAPVVGAVFAHGDIDAEFKSNYTVANGIGRIFTQNTPPIAVGDNSQACYASWSRSQSPEPLPDQRLWVIYRSGLFDKGNMTVQAVRADTTISCQGKSIEAISISNQTAVFGSNMARHNWRAMQSDDHVKVRLGKAVAVWVDDFSFDSATQSSANLIFAAINGTLEGGIQSELSNGWVVSSVNCKVSVNFVDDQLTIGSNTPAGPVPTLSSNALTATPEIATNHTNETATLNENALWFAVAPLLVAVCIDGSQPLYYRWVTDDKILPSAYTDAPYAEGQADYNWSLKNLKDFIEAAIGTVAHASSMNNPTGWTLIQSRVSTKKLYPGRSIYLAIPLTILIVGEVSLLFWSTHVHRSQRIPVMRMASIGELLKSALTDYFFDLARQDCGKSQYSKLEKFNVRSGWTTGPNGRVAGLADQVVPFLASRDAEANAAEGEANAVEGEANAVEDEVNAVEGEANAAEDEVNAGEGEVSATEDKVNAAEGEAHAAEDETNVLEVNSRGDVPNACRTEQGKEATPILPG